MKLSKQDQDFIEKLLLEIIMDSYTNWRIRLAYDPKYKEPSLSTVWLRDYLDQARTPDDYRYASNREQSQMINLALSRLHRKGLIKSSIGVGIRGEARMWEPV